MTLNEKRLLLFGISKINPSTFPDPSKPFKFEMNAKDWREQFGGENPYLMLTRASEKLMGRTLTLHEKVRNSAVPDKTVMQWFDTVEYYEKQSRIVVSFGRGVQVRLAGMLEQFTTMDCVNTNKGTKELKRAVLNPSIKQLNEKSDLFCIVQDIKEGRTITGFKFVFRTQEQKKLL